MNQPFQVINEYEILKKILSNLQSKDLIAASKVCQDWKNVSDIIIQQNADISCTLKVGEVWPDLNSKIRPKLIIFDNDTNKYDDVWKRIHKHYDLSNTCIINLRNSKFINTLKVNNKYEILQSSSEHDVAGEPKHFPFKESLTVVPEFNSLKIDYAFIHLSPSRWSKNDKIKVAEKIKKSKCCLFITNRKNQSGCADIFNYIVTLCNLTDNNENQLIMAGGIAQSMMVSTNGGRFANVGGAVITFTGENLSAKSFVILYKADLTNSFIKMAEEVGPVEPGFKRIAFVFTCVDRYYIHKEEETKEFSKFFPNVYLHGFWSFGEYCMGYNELPKKRKRFSCSDHTTIKGKQFFFQQASTYLFITFKK